MRHIYLFLLFLFSTSVFASESFGGIGVTVYGNPEGLRVAEVIPNSPAFEAGLLAGDKIVEMDRHSLKGLSQDECVSKLRGIAGRPLELTVLRDGEKLFMAMRRVSLHVENIDKEALRAWYGSERDHNLDATEIQVYVESALSGNKNLLGLVNEGRLLSGEAKLQSGDLKGVFVEKENVFDAPVLAKPVQKGSALKALTRTNVVFELVAEGVTTIQIFDANGEFVFGLDAFNALKGLNQVAWDASKLPSGRYLVKIHQNNAISGHFATLR